MPAIHRGRRARSSGVRLLAAGDSLTYTRTFPDNDYWVYLREAVLNLDQAEAVLERVTRDLSGNQNPTLLGHFEGQRSGFEYRNVPLMDTDGRPVKVHLNGVERLRRRQMTDPPEDGGIALNYLVFAPEVDVCAWVESAADPAGPYAQDLTATMQGSTVTVKPLTGQARFFPSRLAGWAANPSGTKFFHFSLNTDADFARLAGA